MRIRSPASSLEFRNDGKNTHYTRVRDWSVNPQSGGRRGQRSTLRYATVGQGEPVLCIHGTNIADSVITPLRGFYPALFEDYKLISYYRAGYNGSTLKSSELSIEESADHVKGLLDHLGLEKAHILAFSFGGVIAFQFMLSYPERVHSAILLEPYLPREAPDAVQANIDAFMGAMELYKAGRKLEAAQYYMVKVFAVWKLPSCGRQA